VQVTASPPVLKSPIMVGAAPKLLLISPHRHYIYAFLLLLLLMRSGSAFMFSQTCVMRASKFTISTIYGIDTRPIA
jgi:hypothetical protein